MAIVTQIIGGAAGTIVPTIVLDISAVREAGNIVHPILGTSAADITLRPGSLRSGVLEMGFSGATADADSRKALDIHAAGTVLTLVHVERPSTSMTYIATGRSERVLDDTTRDDWIVRAEYQEVRPG